MPETLRDLIQRWREEVWRYGHRSLLLARSAIVSTVRKNVLEGGPITDETEQRQRVDARVLSGLLPVCAYCHAVRDESQCWRRIEEYLTDRLEVTISHGICPECRDKVEQDMAPRPPRSGPP